MKDLHSTKVPYHRPTFSTYGSISDLTQQGPTSTAEDNQGTANAMSQRNR